MEKAVEKYFPEHSNWDLPKFRQEQAEDIQIIAQGLKYTPSLVIYDNGEGQHPEDFDDTFLSLLRGNKNEIHFVQGKYNMGGSGALVFCGDKRYQLIGSRRYDESGDFGFTLLRRHPLSGEERTRKKNTWYEYLKIDGSIPSFPIGNGLDLGLHNRPFTTGSILKLYSYNLPSGAKSIITRDLNRHLNEFLFEPALPVYTIEGRRDKYPHDKNPERDLYGLKRRLEDKQDKYIDETFSLDCESEDIGGKIKITCYVFKSRIDGKSVKETKKAIRSEFFQNNMRVVFSVNGQVHGHYTTEFISRSLKYGLLKNYLLIHVDVTDLDVEFRNELFMASRDRLKQGDESSTLRNLVAKELKSSRLKDIYKRRKSSMNVESESTKDLVRQFAENLSMDEDMTKLLNQTLKLDQRSDNGKQKRKSPSSKQRKNSSRGGDKPSFEGHRHPSYFNLRSGQDVDGRRVITTPLGGQRTVKFETDVEDQYFDRVRDPGDLKISILDYSPNETKGGDELGHPDQVSDIFDIVKSSPDKGKIRVRMKPKSNVSVGDAYQTKVSLSAPGQNLEEIFWVKIGKPRKNNGSTKTEKSEPDLDNLIGLPELIPVFESADKGKATWANLADVIDMDYGTIMHPFVNEEDRLEKIFVNMDSRVLLNYKSSQSGEEGIKIAENRYLSSVYFHTLFLYTITKNRGYQIKQPPEDGYSQPEEVELGDYLKDVFDSYYSEFLLNFETGVLIEAIAD
ncbi:hypothetical protein CRI93_07425 [Longimonas halophila]|uniref:Uncharacterized protein n=1 Tax=Longimonas halophila TaxID=1469170 RepID=A0A2H3NTH4_9BACT|nr:hypothetical protein CRI93_07425 [Longimonas halophila]